ncbi:MAG: ABC transporter ATP-binding protein [Firmicutes bacterium]|nr:ABC transporter ATP-binding protein [Bacillota bacterium]
MRGIVKRFPGVVANAGVDFELRRGEVHALLGENGAGKTTLMKILYGLCLPDAGEIRVHGRPVRIDGPRRAIALGIGMVHQHFMLIPPFTVAENIVLGLEPRRGPAFDLSRARAEVAAISERYGLQVDPDARIETISLGMQQRVEILKALYRQADVLILDEPTAVLTPQEVGELVEIIRRLAASGKSIVFITHKLREVMSVADRVTVLRRGERIGTLRPAETTLEELARMMVGREVALELTKEPATPDGEVLRLRDVSALNDRHLPALRRVSLSVRAGEILGIAGVEGNGQAELVEVIAGLRPITTGEIFLGDRRIDGLGPRRIHELGVAYVPEDRQRRGLILDFSLAENLILVEHRRRPFARGPALDRVAIHRHAERLIAEYDIRAAGTGSKAGALSGGNQQKVVVARALASRPRLLLVSQPTRGLDVGATEFVHRRILTERDRGAAVLLVSLELDELLALSDRIAVIYEGEIVGLFARDEVSEDELGLLMAGGRAKARR